MAIQPLQESYSESLATESDKADARRAAGEVRYGLGCAGGIFFWVIMLIVFSKVQMNAQSDTLLALIVIGFSVGGAFLIPYLAHSAAVDKHLKRIVMIRLGEAHSAALAREATSTSTVISKVETIYCQQKSNLVSLHQLTRSTDDALKRAEQFFSERAFSPFWDSIEEAVENLRLFDKRVDNVTYQAKEYYSTLTGRQHTFPAFPIAERDLPKPDALLKILGDLINVAQRDFHFAQIFEQRRTTSAIVTGFRNTQEAISSLGDDLVNSLSDLQRSLEDGLADVSSSMRDGFTDMAERHERSASDLRETLDRNARDASERGGKHEKFVEGALDNIQNKRKPRMSETKEPLRPS